MNFRVIEPAPGVLEVLEIDDDNICQNVPLSRVVDVTLKYVANELRCDRKFSWDYDKTLKFARFWRGLTPPIEKPDALKWADEAEKIAYHSMPWEFGGGDW